MNATVVVATYNRASALRLMLESLERQRVPRGFTWDVIVVDNNSTDGTRTIVESFVAMNPERIRYLLERRQGKTFALNTGLAAARGDVIAFTDDDVILDPHWLGRLVHAVRAHGCACAGGRILPVWSRPRPAWIEMEGPYRLGSVVVSMDLGDAPCWFDTTDTLPLGANMAITAAALKRVGLFRTDLGPAAGSEIRGEDSDICRRLIAAGERLLYVPNATVFHPVDERRLHRRYFRRYYFDQGRAITREEGLPADAVCYANVPRYLIRPAIRRGLQWLQCFDRKRRFYYQLQFWYALGRIVEARALMTREARRRLSPVRLSEEVPR